VTCESLFKYNQDKKIKNAFVKFFSPVKWQKNKSILTPELIAFRILKERLRIIAMKQKLKPVEMLSVPLKI